MLYICPSHPLCYDICHGDKSNHVYIYSRCFCDSLFLLCHRLAVSVTAIDVPGVISVSIQSFFLVKLRASCAPESPLGPWVCRNLHFCLCICLTDKTCKLLCSSCDAGTCILCLDCICLTDKTCKQCVPSSSPLLLCLLQLPAFYY